MGDSEQRQWALAVWKVGGGGGTLTPHAYVSRTYSHILCSWIFLMMSRVFLKSRLLLYTSPLDVVVSEGEELRVRARGLASKVKVSGAR